MLSEDQIKQLLAGAVAVLPTDTVYGLVCVASNPEAVARLYSLKQRHTKPGTIIAADTDQLIALDIPRRYLTPVEHFWPNPISVVIPIGLKHQELHLGKMSLALRIPRLEQLRQLLKKTGPLLTTSANPPGGLTATTVAEARAYFGDAVDFYIDGGDLGSRPSSTVIRVVDDVVEVLREGAVVVDEAGQITNVHD